MPAARPGSVSLAGPIEPDPEHWLTLLRAPGLGPRTLRRLLHAFGDVAAICRAAPADLRACGLEPAAVAAVRRPDAALRRLDLAWLARPGHALVPLGSARYPGLLAAIDDAPLALFTSGDAGLLAAPQVAVVGTRRPSANGAGVAREMARRLGEHGLVVTSGLARGIDAAAHDGALAAEAGTVAVLGCGIDRCYPAVHARLRERIEAGGLVVAEFPPGVAPLAGHFPRRNRIISGLSLGVVVVEAARRSGSLITARLAGEQGRDVFAVPGSVRNPVSAGCHLLLRQGAVLAESVEDVLAELQPGLLSGPRAPAPSSAPDESPPACRVLEAMGVDAVTLDELVERTALTPQALLAMLVTLELEGEVVARAGGCWERCGGPAA